MPAPTEQRASIVCATRLRPQDHERIEAAAQRLDVSMSAYLRSAALACTELTSVGSGLSSIRPPYRRRR